MLPRWIALLACLATSACSYEPLDVAPSVDLARFQGKWFEIAKLPRPTQADCTATTSFFTMRDGGLDITNECHLTTLDGQLRSSAARVSVSGEGGNSKLAIQVGAFSGDYWVLEVGEHYEYAVIGVPSRKYLWILSRTSKLDQAVLDGIVARMRAANFVTSRLEYTRQTP